MFDRELTLYRFMDGYATILLEDVSQEQMTKQPTQSANHPAWHLGHLAVAGSMALKLAGREPACPRKWFPLFGRGSTPTDDPAKYPDKQTLLDTLHTVHAKVGEAVAEIPPEKIFDPNPIEDLRQPLPTLGDLLAHLLTTHEAMHMGQIAAWRNAMGLPRVF